MMGIASHHPSYELVSKKSTQQVDDNMVRMVYRSLKNTPANPA
jgi:hypothetical protein